LARRPVLAFPVIAALVTLNAAARATHSTRLDSPWYLARLAEDVESTRSYFLSHYPTFPPHSRVYLSDVPANLGLVPGDGGADALRAWYGDSTLTTAYLSHYLPRRPGEPAGTDYFLRWDADAASWSEQQRIATERPSYDQWEEFANTMWSYGRV